MKPNLTNQKQVFHLFQTSYTFLVLLVFRIIGDIKSLNKYYITYYRDQTIGSQD